MKASSLHDVWASPDNSRVTPKQFSFRLPIHVAAKIAALCEMYPQKSRTQIIADLLTTALDELEQSLPMSAGAPVDEQEEHDQRWVCAQIGEEYEALFHMGGPRAKFRHLANEHFRELERELGNENPEPLFGEYIRTADHFKQQEKS